MNSARQILENKWIVEGEKSCEWRMINPKDNDDVFPPKTSFCQTLNSGLLLLQYMVPVLISAVYNQFTGQLYIARLSDDNAQYSSKITR